MNTETAIPSINKHGNTRYSNPYSQSFFAQGNQILCSGSSFIDNSGKAFPSYIDLPFERPLMPLKGTAKANHLALWATRAQMKLAIQPTIQPSIHSTSLLHN